jgi:RNA-directed DNA polymerase
MPMVQKLNYPNTEMELRKTQDEMFRLSKVAFDDGKRPSYKNLIEVAKSEAVIISAIHKIKANKGSKTTGIDGKNIDDILKMEYEEVINLFQNHFDWYKPKPVRRKLIDKPGKKEKRPLGIPTIEDRIVQECVRLTIEPILEAQFFQHSYGFRPMREASQALYRISDLAHKTGYNWVIEGDISKFFDKINHTVLVKKLYGMGIKDRRMLMIIKSMLKAGVFKEIRYNEMGTPQGGIISPLLANVYLDTFDQWMNSNWEGKETKHTYSRQDGKYNALRKNSNLKPAFLVRYADDWVVLTNSHNNAKKWKHKISIFLKEQLKLELSDEKTKITNIKKKHITFLGFDYKRVPGKSKQGKGYVSKSSPNREKFASKIKQIKKDLYMVRKRDTHEKKINDLIKINSKIRGILNYFQYASNTSNLTTKFSRQLSYAAWNSLAPIGATWKKAKLVDNLLGVHSKYETSIPAIPIKPLTKGDLKKQKKKQLEGKDEQLYLGVTNLSFVNFKEASPKSPKETPYSEKGREIYTRRTRKKPPKARADELISLSLSHAIAHAKREPSKQKYNFEYMMNRCYAFIRDKGKCRICGDYLEVNSTHTHHTKTNLPLESINKVGNLASMHHNCHYELHNADISNMNTKKRKKIEKFREMLGTSY